MHPLLLALLIYSILMGIIVFTKPATVYDAQTKQYKKFGHGKNNTRFPIWLVAILVGIFSYVIATILHPYLLRRIPSTTANQRAPSASAPDTRIDSAAAAAADVPGVTAADALSTTSCRASTC